MFETETHASVGEITRTPFATSLDWKIKDFFEFPYKVDQCVDGPAFNFLNATWHLRLYPNGRSESKTEGWISLYLVRKHSTSPRHRIRFRIGIMNTSGTMARDSRTEYTFTKNSEDHGWHRFYGRRELNQQRKYLVPKGVLTVLCSMTATVREGVKAAATMTSLGVQKLGEDFNNLLLSKESTDMIIRVKNREYEVHRAVMVARSPVFCVMLKHMKEKNCGYVQIDDCDPGAFGQFLAYLYSGNIKIFSVATVFDLHTIADKYDAQELKASCIQYVTDNISPEIFCDVLSLSLKYNESKLLQKCTDYFAKNSVNILVTLKWFSFLKENPVESNELLIKAAEYNAKHTVNSHEGKV